MDESSWRQQTSDRLRTLARTIESWAPNLLYGAVTGCAILPLVAAAQQGQLPYDALYGVLGGAGLNLVSNLIQQWKDRGDAEEKLAAELTEAAAGDADWRAVQDTLLEKFDMLPALQASLGDADKAWFERSMRQALQQVGSRVTLTIAVHGGQHVAAGQYVTQVINYYVTPGEQTDAKALERYVHQYLAWVQETYGRVTLRGVNRSGNQVIELPLEDVYVPLTAHSRSQMGSVLNLNQLLQQGNRIVVTGGPGCGKTTVLQHVAWALATAIATDDPHIALNRIGLEVAKGDAPPLPFYVPLSSYARYRRKHRDDDDPSNRTLTAFISDYLIERNFAPGLPRDFFARLLAIGRGVILLLDGLDEVSDEQERAVVREAIESFLAGKLIVLAEFEKIEILVLIQSLVQSQFPELASDDMSALIRDMKSILSVDPIIFGKRIASFLNGRIELRNAALLSLTRDINSYGENVVMPLTLADQKIVKTMLESGLNEKLTELDEPDREKLLSAIDLKIKSASDSVSLSEDIKAFLVSRSELWTDKYVAVRGAINSFLENRPSARAIVTCRVAAYKDRTALGGYFREIRVEPIEDEHIAALVTRAYDCYFAHDTSKALNKRSELLAGIELLEQQRRVRLGADAPRLVDSPLMVRLLLIVHLNERRLPQHRAELYQKAVDNLLYPEYSLDEAAAEHLSGLVGHNRERHLEMVQHIAFAMHNQGPEQGREIDEVELRRILETEPNYAPYVDDLIRNTRLRGALLEEVLGSYRFVHLAFQEFLAARYLAEVMRTEQEIAQFLVDHAIGDPWWREPALLTAGYLSLTSRRTADRLLRLLAVWEGHSAGNHHAADVRLAAAELAGTACLEWLGDEAVLREYVTTQLAVLFTNDSVMEQVAPPIKLLSGDVLGRLGDPRPGVGIKHDLPDIVWMEIPGVDGQDRRHFLYNDGEQDWKYPGLPAFWMARFPITYAQFQAFVDAPDGYRNREWRKGLADYFHDDKTYWQQRWPIANRPRENVTWPEAVAFCRWLTAQARQRPYLLPDPALADRLDAGWSIRLPMETEWVKAARGWDDRLYPWGGQAYDAGRANVDESGKGGGQNNLQETSAVGMYPHGASPFGVEEMSGNVWEYCLNKYNNPDDLNLGGDALRAMRGGSWYNNAKGSSVASRVGVIVILNVVNRGGFRVVCAASPSL